MPQPSMNSEDMEDMPNQEILDDMLRAAFYRQDCPDPLVLGEYKLGILAEPEQANIQAHLARCPHCPTELDRLTDFFENESIDEPIGISVPQPPTAPDPSWQEVALDQGRAWLETETKRWRQLWLSLPPLWRQSQEAPALAGMLQKGVVVPPSSSQGTMKIAPPKAHFEMQLSVVSDQKEQDLCRLNVDLTLKDRFGDFSGVQVTLLWNNSAQSKETNPQGEVSFTGLPIDQLASMRLLVTFPE